MTATLHRLATPAPAGRGAATPARAAPLGERVATQLRADILEGRRAPGERLIEDRLSEELGVSRVPIREALRALAAEGLVELLPRRGASVARISPQTVRDLIEVRATLEALNARLAARNHDAASADELRRILAAGDAAATSGNAGDLVRLNGEFHDKLAQAGRNSVLWELMRTLRERTNLIFAANAAPRAKDNWTEHSAILAAVLDADEELAAMLAARHVTRAADAALGRENEAGRTRATRTASDGT